MKNKHTFNNYNIFFYFIHRIVINMLSNIKSR